MRLTLILAILLGGIAILLQIVLLRGFLAIFWGNELLIGVVFFFWMLWTGWGAVQGVRCAPLAPQKSSRLLSAAVFSALVLLAGLSLIRWIFSTAPGEYPGGAALLLLAAAGLAAPGYFLGATFRELANTAASRCSQAAATIYIFESIGSVVGSLLFTFLLVHWLRPIPLLTLLLFSLLMMQLATRRWFFRMAILLPLTVTALFFSVQLDRTLSAIYWRTLAPGAHLVDQRTSRYGELAVLDWQGEKHLYLNSLHQTSLPERIDNPGFAALIMNQPPLQPRRVLLMGSGSGGLAPELARYPQTRLTCLEMDRTAFELSQSHLTPTDRHTWDSLGIHVQFGDGRKYLLRNPGIVHDVLIVLPGRPVNAAVNRFYSEDFFALASARLSPRGFLVVGRVPGGENFLGDELVQLNRAIYQGLRAHFTTVLALPGAEALYLASNDSLITFQDDILAANLRKQAVETPHFSPLLFTYRLPEERIDQFKALLASAPARKNLDFQPIVYYLELLVWQKMMDSLHPLFRGLLALNYTRLILIWSACLLAGLLWWYKGTGGQRRSQYGLCFAAAVAGFAAMAFNVMGIMALQSLFGSVYEQIGLALAAFMLGLSGGAWLTWRWQHPPAQGACVGLLLAIALYAVGMAPFLHGVRACMHEALLFVWIIGAGALTGALFPLIARLYEAQRSRPHPGIIYAADIAGGACSALCTATFFIPVYGFARTAGLIMVLAMCAALAVGLARNKN